VDEAVLSLGYLPDAFMQAYPDDQAAGVRLTYAVEPDPLDTAGAVRFAATFAGIAETFVVVNGDGQAPELAGIPIGRAELARGGATKAAVAIAHQQVLEHGLRHLAWLARDDEVVRSVLSEEWRSALAGYVPEPFRHLG